MIAAILRAQFLTLWPRKGRGARGGTVFSTITGSIFYAVFVFLGWVLMLLFSSEKAAPQFLQLLSAILLVATLYWQFVPVISASFGWSIDLRKLLAYPIPRSQLFQIELMLRAVTSFDVVIVIAGIVVGLLRNPLYGWRYSPGILTGALTLIAMNVVLSVGVKSWLERTLFRTRFKEVFFVLLVLVSITPQLLVLTHVKRPFAILRYVPSQFAWPWAAAAHLMLHEGGIVSGLMAAAWLCVVLLFSRRQFGRTLRFDGSAMKRREKESSPDSLSERLFRLPSGLFGDPLGALVEKELRTLCRISRFRMSYAMSCFFGVIVFTPSLRGRHASEGFSQYALPLMAVYGLMMLGPITFWNSFGFDRSAAQGYFSWPVKFRDALIAKNITVMALLAPQVLLISLVAHALGVASSPAKIFETFVVMAIAALFWFGLGNIFSVRAPRSMNPDKMNQMANKLQSLTIFAAPLVLLPIVLAYWARAVFSNELVFAGILAIAGILGAIFYGVGLDSADKAAHERRESFLMELSRSDGPISTA